MPCPCSKITSQKSQVRVLGRVQLTAILIALLGIWLAIYLSLDTIASFLARNVFQLTPKTHLYESVQFFCYDTPKIFLLLSLVVFVMAQLRRFITPERTRKILAGKWSKFGYALAATFGIATPFCSCSAVPIFIGFVTADVPLGITFSFLIAAPLINEVAVILLWGLLGWKIALLYLSTGWMIAVVSGWVLGKLHLEQQVESWVREHQAKVACGCQVTTTQTLNPLQLGWQDVKEIVGRVWLFMIIGIAIGAGIHGYVPAESLRAFLQTAGIFAVPLAVVIGVPMYSNAAGMIPVVQALLEKGMGLGIVLAFMMAVTALSLPEMVILRKVLKPKLLAIFIAIVTLGILCVGYLFTFLSL